MVIEGQHKNVLHPLKLWLHPLKSRTAPPLNRSLMIFDRHANLKYKYGNRHFWARGYYVDTVGRNKKQIQEYIKNQLTEDQIADQVELKEFVDPFTGSVNKKA